MWYFTDIMFLARLFEILFSVSSIDNSVEVILNGWSWLKRGWSLPVGFSERIRLRTRRPIEGTGPNRYPFLEEWSQSADDPRTALCLFQRDNEFMLWTSCEVTGMKYVTRMGCISNIKGVVLYSCLESYPLFRGAIQQSRRHRSRWLWNWKHL